ncbi:hypothetical protein C7C45_24055 [Micromonospora arborensis]|uniref:Uncharacterized protein n=1 Tax=Micromonospora arborensis TaxID=2116518 RepID=A0A318NFT5_9ACTN|nr:hypothetical protein C7C45_24055 [Micromonospora arborensis]
MVRQRPVGRVRGRPLLLHPDVVDRRGAEQPPDGPHRGDEVLSMVTLLPEVRATHSGVEIRPVVDHG